ncbi:MAG: DUF998 domain-containing protein [Methanocellales archaeon]|nr:DUF998 domain-containing protein [Methanocellales archaeon]MDD3420677.1 DUF998 domain-containing protein [Methanocellales archaeon]MDD4897849.1 DUF998 domain-containing protein [Methanocellales archaeon]MDD5447388.1 DUF998 domain-containing protein [Methanocellales archaeon]
MSSRPKRVQRMLAICGIVGPILYTIVLIAIGLLRPGYNHLKQFMSELGEVGGPNAIIMNTIGFMLLGVLMIAFSLGLHRGIKEGSKIGPALIAISGVGWITVGLFHVDPNTVNASLKAMLHVIGAMLVGLGFSTAPFAIARRSRKDHRWVSYRPYSLATGLLTAILGLVFIFGGIEGWMGALQRMVIGVPLLWIEVMAIRLLRLS